MKLNKSHKETLIENVINIKFPLGKFEELEKQIGTELRNGVVAVEGWEKYSKHIPTTSMLTLYHVYGNNPYDYNNFKFNVEQYPSNGCEYKNVIFDKNIKEHKKFTKDQIASKKVHELFNKLQKLKEEYAEFKKELDGALSSINTDNQLKEHLPELVKYLPISRNCGLVPIATFKNIRSKLKGL